MYLLIIYYVLFKSLTFDTYFYIIKIKEKIIEDEL